MSSAGVSWLAAAAKDGDGVLDCDVCPPRASCSEGEGVGTSSFPAATGRADGLVLVMAIYHALGRTGCSNHTTG